MTFSENPTSTPNTTTTPSAAPTDTVTPIRPAPAWRQMRALASSEWQLLRRNTVALINTLFVPVLMVGFFALFPVGGELQFGVVAPILLLGMALMFVVYYTLVTALVARREAYVLQRLRSGEASDAVILGGLSLPFVLITVVQSLLGVVGAVLLLDADTPTNPVLILVATVGSAVVWALLAVASTGFTRSVEHAQITTMPLLLVAILGSGLSVPLTLLPEWAQTVAAFTPMHPVVELMRLGMAGATVDGTALDFGATFTEAVQPLAVLVLWTFVALWAIRRYLRWEPRR